MAEKIVRDKAKNAADTVKKSVETAKNTEKKAAAAAKSEVKKAAEKVEKPAKKAAEAVEKPAKETTPAAAKPAREVKPAKAPKGSSILYRVLAFVLWACAITCEVFAIMALTKNFVIRFSKGNASNNVLFTLILFIVLDLIFAIIAAQLWKRANRISPMSEKNKFLFYLWNELGVIMAIICFLPLIIFLLKDKKLDKKTKIIATVVAIVAMLVAGVASAEFNPISAEEKKSAENLITQDVCWTAGGHKYHIDDNCQSIRNSDYYKGTVKEAIESGKGTLCAFCAREVNEAAAAAMNPDTATPQQLEKLALLKELGYDETGIINIAQHLESLKTEGDVQSAVKAAEPEANNLVQDETKTEEKR